MSLITRCPACRTLFKVVPDQLRISEGWVRCGQCDEIFDASAHLQEVTPQPPQSAALPDLDEPSPPAVASDAGVGAKAAEPVAAQEPVTVQEPDLSVEVPEDGPWGETVAAGAGDVGLRSAGAAVPPMPDEPEPAEAAPSEKPSFMREMPVPAAGRAGLRRRLVYVVAAVMLTLLLALQVLLHERDRLAASTPGLQPLLGALCALMQCSMAPLRQIESVQIDSASFTKVRPEVYRLSLTLKNTASTDLALPAIELALTDTQDQPLLRRVILAGELGLSGETLAAGSDASVSLTLGVKSADGAEQFAGYRVLAFYP